MTVSRRILAPLAHLAGLHASRQVAAFLAAHQRTAAVQDALLRQLLSLHAGTGFGRDHGFASLAGYRDFCRAVPVRRYEDLRPYVDRVLQGETTALLPAGEPVLMFSMTSGTTGKPKHIPVTPRFLAQMRRGWNILGLKALRDHPRAWLRPIVQITSAGQECLSPCGVPCGAISGMLAATQKRIVRMMYCVPRQVACIADSQARYYTIMRCAADKDVAVFTTANPSSTIKLIETAQAHTDRLLKDVAEGTYNPPGEVDQAMRRQLRFRANPGLARRVQQAAARDGQLLPSHLWNTSMLLNWTGGTLRLYLPRLRQLFGPSVAVRDIGLLASEGRFSVPLADDTPAGVAEITGNFLEFLPAEQAASASPQPLRAEQTEVGREYLLIVTNWAGLWRYNIEDRLRVVDKLGQSPVFEFLCRDGNTSSITGEKITEHQVVQAMQLAAARCGCPLQQFLLQGRFAAEPYYQLRVEPWGAAACGAAADDLAARFDEALCELNIEYASKRKTGRLGPVRATLLPAGTLKKIELEKIASRRGRGEQYKHQYLLTDVVAGGD